MLQLMILAGYRQQRRAAHRTLVVQLRSWPPVVRARVHVEQVGLHARADTSARGSLPLKMPGRWSALQVKLLHLLGLNPHSDPLNITNQNGPARE